MYMSKRILVIGSIAIDNTIFTKKLPEAGTTTLADSYFVNVGGKGANQACACHFLGGDVTFIGAVGKDKNGESVEEFLKTQGLNARIKHSDKPTGVAFIILDETNAENRILIVQGANTDISIEDIDNNEDLFREGDILLTQFENAVPTVEHILKKAYEHKMIVVLNPAPYKEVNRDYFKYIDYIVPNEHELELLTKTKNIQKGAYKLLKQGAKNVIVTLGEKGSIMVDSDKNIIYVRPHKVQAVDTTGAGDSYLGAFVTRLAAGDDVLDALSFASKASSYTVSKKGAIIALPHLEDLK